MARTQSKIGRLLEFAEPSNSTPGLALPPGRYQARRDDLPSLSEASSMASMGRLFRMRPFFQRSTDGVEEQEEQSQLAPPQGTDRGAQEEQGEPQAVSTNDAEKSTRKPELKPEPDLTSASAGKVVDAAVKEFNGIDPMSLIAKGAVDGVGGDDAAFTEIQNLGDAYLQPFKLFNSFVTTSSNVHPYAQVALGILFWISRLFIDQANLDKEVSDLLDTVRNVYVFLLEEDRLSNVDKDTLARIAQTTSNSAHFIKNYSATKRFWKRLGKHIVSETRTVVNDHAKSLESLMQQCRDGVARVTHLNTYRILEDHNFDGMAYAGGAGLNTVKKCLDGTRTEILEVIVNWINDPDANVPHILWLHGQAGRGKSAIAHTIASWIKDVGGLGSCFCFARDRQAEGREKKIVTTIARDLAGRDATYRRALADVLSNDPSLKTTPDVMLQWQRLILEPLSKIKGTIAGNVVIVIDALDESGPDASRKHILSLLTSTAATHFPPNLRVLLTSRLLPDIARALSAVRGVKATSLDDIPMAFAERDIRLYVSRELALLPEIGTTEVQNIAGKSNGLFEWARLACEFILRNRLGQTNMERYDDIIALDTGGGGALLDVMYRIILEDLVPMDGIALARFLSVMRQIMSTLVPQRLDALNEMRSHFPSEEDRFDMDIILKYMTLLLSGIVDRTAIVRPLHSSFYDFLRDPSRSGVYYVDGSSADMHSSLASASLRTLSSDSKANVRELVNSLEDEVETGQEDADRRMDSAHPEIDEPLVDVWVPGPDFLEFGTSPLSGPEVQKTGVMSRLATLLRRRKSPQCAQERMQTFSVAAAREKMRVLIIPWKGNKREGRTEQSGEGNTLHQIDTVTSAADTRDGQISDDGYHESHCMCCFRS